MILARSPSTGVTRCAVFLPLKTLSVPGASGSVRTRFVVAGEQAADAVVVRVVIAPQPAAVLKISASERRLQEHGDG